VSVWGGLDGVGGKERKEIPKKEKILRKGDINSEIKESGQRNWRGEGMGVPREDLRKERGSK